MYSSDDAYKNLPEKEIWTILFLGKYALGKLEQTYDDRNNSTSISICTLCRDQRRTPTVRKHLISLGLITGTYRLDDRVIPIEDEVEKILEGFSKEPTFNTTGYIEKKKNSYSYDKELLPVTDLSEVYREVDDLNAYEIIYVYLNQKLYDFKMFKTTTKYRNRKSLTTSSHEKYDLKVYPLSALNVMDDAALLANNETFAKSHAREILTAAFGCRFKCISDDKEYMTKEAVNKRLINLKDKLRRLQRSRKELLLLQRKLDILGEEALKKKLLDTSLEYIKTKAPLWLNLKGMDEDSTKRDLALLICKGIGVTLEKTNGV